MNKPKHNKTPRLANWLAFKLLKGQYIEEFLGDLEEVYLDRIGEKGKFNANIMYWFDIIHLVIGFSSFSLFKTQNNHTIMLKNMFKIAWRNAVRQKQFSVLNLLGLTVGITACIFIGLYVHSETTYDEFHEKADRIYRINQPMIWNDWDEEFSSTGPNVAVALREDAPEFEEVTRMLSLGAQIVKHPDSGKKGSSFKESKYSVAEDNFFEVFSFEFIQGNSKTALNNPFSLVITLETAERYFGFEQALGRTLEVKDWDGSWKTYTITGVLSNIPDESHLKFDMLASLSSHSEQMKRDGWKWIWTGFSTYGLVYPGTNIELLKEKIQAIPPKWAPLTTEKIFNQTFEEFTAGKPWTLYLQPLDEIYLSDQPSFHRFGPTGNPQYVTIFSTIGILILALSCINFMNLSTAQSAKRSKEVGVRKVLGSNRQALIFQFIFESMVFVITSVICALIISQFTISAFNHIIEKNLSLDTLWLNSTLVFGMIIFILTLGIIAGSYPAFYLSSFKPIEVLKRKSNSGFKGRVIRNGLVIFQFTISIALIICTFFVQKQLAFTSTLDVGFKKDHVLRIHNIEQFGFDTDIIKTSLASNPAFSAIGKSFGNPPEIWSGDRYKAFGPDNPVVQLRNFRTEKDYLDLLGIEFIEGRNFDESRRNDKYSVILNEAAVKTLNWGSKESFQTDSPIGKFVSIASGDEQKFEVIGVVKDFNFNSLKQKIEPLIIINHQNDQVWDYGAGLSFYSARLNSEVIQNNTDLQMIIEDIKKQLASLDATVPFEYSFLDQAFQNTFKSEYKMGNILNIFTAMALTIACLGLFGLAAFSAEQRIKELGIRKVLGAKISQLVLLFSKEFINLIGLSILMAVPLAYYSITFWLDDFAYKTRIEIWVFVTSALSTLIIALITVSFQSLKAAYKNPVETLKDE